MDDLEPALKIRTKVVHVLITNACNLTCGGCNQLVGHFPKEKVFHVPVERVRAHIKRAIDVAKVDWQMPWFPPKHRHLSIYGGEPTVHPQWPAILRMLYDEFADWPFVILTNGRTFNGQELPQSGDDRFDYIKRRRDVHAHDKNVFWRIDVKRGDREFTPTLIAPIDVLGDPNPGLYYELAKRNCHHYAHCETLIYHGKGYFCVNAGPMDWLFHDGANGWDIENTPHPFQRTNDEIAAQGKLFCHRCHFCLGESMEIDESIAPAQMMSGKSLVSETNFSQIRPGSGQLVTLCVKPSHQASPIDREGASGLGEAGADD